MMTKYITVTPEQALQVIAEINTACLQFGGDDAAYCAIDHVEHKYLKLAEAGIESVISPIID